jgi:N-methylhydantoinase A/oxoprolinase/acetone carboxylase beta subunit
VVGATNTDGVAMDARDRVVAKVKVPSTQDLSPGIAAAVRGLVAADAVDPAGVTRVMLGTTHAGRALQARRGARRVAVLRIGSPLTHAVPPLATWPAALRENVSAGETIVAGGADYDGRAAAPLDEEAVARFLETVADEVDAVAITAVFAPVAPEQELAAAALVRRELGAEVQVSLSHQIGTLGLLERENATVLNCALVPAAAAIGGALEAILRAEGIDAEPFLAQNDGTLMALDFALHFPVLMIGSGPANSMIGAAHLTGADRAVVVDAGGRALHVGVLDGGFPRQSGRPARIAGVRMGFRTPDVVSLPMGGGSVVHLDGDPPAVGPGNVGADLRRQALSFGGPTPTLTDAAVAGGRAEMGSHPMSPMQRDRLARALAIVDALLERTVETVRGDMPSPPIVVVGGAGMLVPDGLPGAGEVIRPLDGEVANAIGAAMGSIGGQADRICSNRPDRIREALREARGAAVARAIHAGADPDRIEVSEIDEVPLSYMADPAVRIRVRATGPRG